MNQISFDELARLACDPGHGWSIGTFGAIGEFIRDEDEPATVQNDRDNIEIVTARGALRIRHSDSFECLAWDSLSSDGESWGHAMALCRASDWFGRSGCRIFGRRYRRHSQGRPVEPPVRHGRL